LEKNFCAWLLICTAVLVPMCSATGARYPLSVKFLPNQKLCFTVAASCSGKISTLDASPGSAMELQGFQEQLMFVLGPFLPLLRYRVWLPRLRNSRFVHHVHATGIQRICEVFHEVLVPNMISNRSLIIPRLGFLKTRHLQT
jgi:hypothetical protein